MTDNVKPEQANQEKMDGTSLDIAEQRRRELKLLLPGVFTETTGPDGQPVETIDFERLKAELGTFSDVYEGRRERYGMEWPGKRDCMKLIQEPSRATLKPCREESVDFDTTQNLFIEGDNLEVLKLLQKSYYGKVKMIYIDPPYNTGNEFIYPDKYSESLETYLAYAGLVDDEGKKFASNTASEGRFHTRWLNMMYSRLYLAGSLLRQNGVIAISIGTEELKNTVDLCNEVFGEENKISILTWEKGRKNDSTYFSESVEYMVIYAKNKEKLREEGIWRERKPGIDDALSKYEELKNELSSHEEISEAMRQYYDDLEDNNPTKALDHFYRSDDRGLYFGGDISSASTSIPDYEIYHPQTNKPCKKPTRGWGCNPDEMERRIKEGRVHFGQDETTIPLKKNYLFEIDSIVKTPVIYKDGRAATRFQKNIFGKVVFDNPKDHEVLAEIIEYCAKSGGIILDFFAGSGTLAHSCWLNSIKGANYRFILVQLPEKLDPDNKGHKNALSLGMKSISDVCIERLRRTADYINNGEGDFSSLDFGFRNFSLEVSNFKHWNTASLDATDETISEQLELHTDHVAEEATEEDILYELILKSGFPLTEEIASLDVAGKKVYSISDEALILCLEDEVTENLINAVADMEPMQFICLDKGFKGNDQLKANAVQTFKSRSQGAETEMVFKVV